MSVQAMIQTVEEIYRLVWRAVASKRPIEAVYDKRFGCFVRTDWAGIAPENCASCATNMAARAKADWKQRVPRPTGVALRSRSSAG
jgi:hypothetical protein